MNYHDQKGSWKGLLWSLFFSWPIIVLIAFLSFDFEKASVFQCLGFLVLSLTVIPWFLFLVKQIRKRL